MPSRREDGEAAKAPISGNIGPVPRRRKRLRFNGMRNSRSSAIDG